MSGRRLCSMLCTILLLTLFCAGVKADDEFVGPLSSWINVKTDTRLTLHAAGNGVTDDTAALQAAINYAGSIEGKGTNSHVLYLPSGTYLISSTLMIKYIWGLSIFGQDPATTTIKWGGATYNGTPLPHRYQGAAYSDPCAMCYCNGLAYSRFARLTWDGQGKASLAVEHGFDNTPGLPGTGIEHADEVFTNVGYGLREGSFSGTYDGDTTIIRCTFLHCSVAGISVENPNALDFPIWYCTFTSCARGVTNEYGYNYLFDPTSSGYNPSKATNNYNGQGGNFTVNECLFQSSSLYDIGISNTLPISARYNYSIGSAQFVHNFGPSGTNQCLTLQGNTILDTTNAKSIDIENTGCVLLFDNTIRSLASATGPAVYQNSFIPSDMLAVGNTFSVTPAITQTYANSRLREIDDRTVNRSTINPAAPTMPGTLPNPSRPIIEVAPPTGSNNDSTAAIQAAITNAVANYNGQRPVVHLPYSPYNYNISSTVDIPANSDVQLMGDGFFSSTNLLWMGNGAGPMLHFTGPTHATIRDLYLHGNNLATAILLDNCDQTGSHIFADQFAVNHAASYGVLAESLNSTDVSLNDFYFQMNNGIGIHVDGGQQSGGRVACFAGVSTENGITFNVGNGGSLYARDFWYESDPPLAFPRFLNLSGSGNLTLDCLHVTAQPTTTTDAIELHDFSGNVTLLGLEMHEIPGTSPMRIVTYGPGNLTNLLAAGCYAFEDPYFIDNAPNANADLLDCRVANANPGSAQEANIGAPTDAFLRSQLTTARNTRDHYVTNTFAANGVSDLRIYRTYVEYAPTGLDLKHAAVPTPPLVALTSPINGTTAVPPASFSLNATAVATTGGATISQVSFYNGSNLLATVTGTPYSFNWTAVPAGVYTLTAVAKDSNGLAATSALVSVTVSVPMQSTVYEAENGVLRSAVNNPPTIYTDANASGGKGVNTMWPAGNSVTFKNVDGGKGGSGTVTLAYSNGGSTAATALVKVNGGTATSISLSGTGGWTTYKKTAPLAITFTSGTTNTIEVDSDQSGNDTFNFDCITVTAPAVPPSVTLTTPANGAVAVAPASFTLTAAATASGATISQVAFYNGSSLLATATSSPYSYSWTNVPAGAYTLTAVATDSHGLFTTSAPVTVNVYTPPTVTLISPANGTGAAAPASFTLTASATASGATISQVAFYNGSSLLGTATSSPYSYNWANVSIGSYTLTAVATDSHGLSTTSAPVTVNVFSAPIVTLIAPSEGAVAATPGSFTLTATAFSSGATINQVAFYNGSSLLGIATSNPYNLNWTNVPAGKYTLSATATDSHGMSGTSNTVHVTVNQSYEADIMSRPTGDGVVTVADWLRVGLFVVGLDTPLTPGEFQRADCAPRATLGDGQLTIADWVQAGRYAASLDPLTPAGGPTASATTSPAMRAAQLASVAPSVRSVTISTTPFACGSTGIVSVILDAQGDENALGFTLVFDAKRMQFLSAKTIGATAAGLLNVNSTRASSGTLGVALMLPPPKTLTHGKQTVLELTFRAITPGAALLSFGDQQITREVSNAGAMSLCTSFVNGTVYIRK